MARLPTGRRIRDGRKERHLTQSALAEIVGISPSYLNLIEHDKRPIGGALLARIANALGVDVSHLSGSGDAQLSHEIAEVARSRLLPGIDESEALSMVARQPEWARALLALHRKYQGAAEMLLAFSDRLGQDPALMELSHAMLNQITTIRSFAEILEQHPDLDTTDQLRFSSIIASQSDHVGSSARAMIELLGGGSETPQTMSPEKEVDEFIIYHRNHFPDIEDAANELRLKLDRHGDAVDAAITQRLTRDHGVTIRQGDTNEQGRMGKEGGRELILDQQAPVTTARFLTARHLAEIEMADVLDARVEDERLTTEEARRHGRRSLASYAAGALLFPYHRFLEAAENCRYDIDRLSQRFQASFEQIAHRLVTLRRPGAEGIPFAFLRTDPAGNISKPFGIPGLPMPRFGGACPLWALYQAFSCDIRTVTQLATTTQGDRFIFIARRLHKRVPGFAGTNATYSVMLGCDAAHGDRMVYGDAFASGRDTLATPVGFSCRTCGRRDCPQRAHPTILTNENLGPRLNHPDM